MAIPPIEIRISADVKGAQSGVRGVTGDLDHLSSAATQATGRAGSLSPAMKGVGASAAAAASGVASFGADLRRVTGDAQRMISPLDGAAGSKSRLGRVAASLKSTLDRVRGALGGVAASSRTADGATEGLNAAMERTVRRGGGVTRGIQNAAFQMGDFAVQVGAGTDASRALALQLPQLLGGFGVLGAVMGAVVAIAIPLRTAMQGMGEDAQSLMPIFGTLEPLVRSIGDAFRTVGVISLQAAEVLVNNLDRILVIAGTAAAFFAGRWVAGFVAARVATMSLAGALAFLRGAIIRTGFGALIVGAGELVFQFTRLIEAAGSFGQALGLLKDVAIEVWQRMQSGAAAMVQSMKALWLDMKASFIGAISDMAGAAADLLWSIGQGFKKVSGLQDVGISLETASNDVLQAGLNRRGDARTASSEAGQARAAASDLFADASAPLESVQKIRDLLASIKDDRITLPDLLGVGGGDEEEGDGKSGKGGAAKKLKEELSEQEKAIKEHFDRIKALTEGGLRDKLGAWGNYFSNLVSLTGSNNKRLLAIGKSFAAAQALVDAFRAHNAVLADPKLPWFARIASAAQVLAAGIGAVNAIKGVTAGGGSRGAGAAGAAPSAGAAATTAPQQADRFVSIDIQGEVGTAGRSIIAEINEALRNGERIRGIRMA